MTSSVVIFCSQFIILDPVQVYKGINGVFKRQYHFNEFLDIDIFSVLEMLQVELVSVARINNIVNVAELAFGPDLN